MYVCMYVCKRIKLKPQITKLVVEKKNFNP